MAEKETVTITLTKQEAEGLGKLLKAVEKYFGEADVEGQSEWDSAENVCSDLKDVTSGTWIRPLVDKVCD
ncbi:MAG: hypothetical protein DRI90_06925 [Deltaproteobacteria bacterium]|nr:MAG: hypothetical protein DRI90_06925 [Deltaproteobacteria bacterium]